MQANGLYINGTWREGRGESLASLDPATGDTIWQSASANVEDVADAVAAARAALGTWMRQSFDERAAVVLRFAELLAEARDRILKKT